MGIGHCQECGTLCMETPSGLCPRCQQEFFEAEDKVSEHLRSNKNATLESVYQATGVKKHIIMRMIRAGRIIEGELTFGCTKCGSAITTGQFCASCTVDALASLKPSKKPAPEPEQSNGGMYIRDLIENKGD